MVVRSLSVNIRQQLLVFVTCERENQKLLLKVKRQFEVNLSDSRKWWGLHWLDGEQSPYSPQQVVISVVGQTFCYTFK